MHSTSRLTQQNDFHYKTWENTQNL
jgi:hypothetical protein